MAINWSEVPGGAMRSLKNGGAIRWLKKDGEYVFYHDGISWFEYGDKTLGLRSWDAATPLQYEKPAIPKKSGGKYIITMRNKRGESIDVDAYDIITACKITCPAHAHAAKKVLYTGLRGHKDKSTDLRESIDALERAIELATKS